MLRFNVTAFLMLVLNKILQINYFASYKSKLWPS